MVEKKPTPDFRLKDQFGKEAALGDLRGKVVALTFLYSHCPEICPIFTSRFAAAANLMESEVGKSAVFLVVTVDPERDTVERLREYSTAIGTAERLRYLTGSREELEQVWKSYGVYVNRTGAEGNYTVDHSVLAVVVDRQGYIREYFTFEMSGEDLARDMRMLMRE